MVNIDVSKYLALKQKKYYKKLGKVSKIVGLTIESIGPDAKLNDVCRICSSEPDKSDVMAEVVGFKDNRILLMPFESDRGRLLKILEMF